MPFVALPQTETPAASEIPPLKVVVHSYRRPKLQGREGKRTHGCRVRVGREVLRQLGWQKDTLLEILWGTDADHGQVMIRPSTDGSGKPAKLVSKGYAIVNVGTLPNNFKDQEIPRQEVVFARVEHRLKVELPKEFFTDDELVVAA